MGFSTLPAADQATLTKSIVLVRFRLIIRTQRAVMRVQVRSVEFYIAHANLNRSLNRTYYPVHHRKRLRKNCTQSNRLSDQSSMHAYTTTADRN
jgi:hypothetical protein